MNGRNQKTSDLIDFNQTTAGAVSGPKHDNFADASVREITMIDQMVSFFEETCASSVSQQVLRNMAEHLAKRLNDTSPGTLQDVTMDNSYGVGYRSPCLSLNPYQGSTSPSSQQGRTVREFEEQMAALRKENFNLKLRLYFIEESIPNYQHATSNGDGPENLMKQLIDTKVEIEMLRKELQEKQELLKEAAQAMTQMEKIQLDTESKGESQIEELKQRIQYLEMEKDIERTEAGGELMDSLLGYSNLNDNLMTVQKVRELEGLVKQSEERIHQYQNQISKMDNLMEKRDKTIKELEDKVKEQAFQNSELLEQLELQERASCTAEVETLRQELHGQKVAMADKLCMLEELEEELQKTKEKLQERTVIHEKACRTTQKLVSTIKRQQDTIAKLEGYAHPNEDNAHTNPSDVENASADCISNQQHHENKRLENKLKEQESLIAKLQAEVQKKTTNLQSLVNHELWEKNREIERLTQVVNENMNENNETASGNRAGTQILLPECNQGVALKDHDKDEAMTKDLINELQLELIKVRNEAENAEKWRCECADVCAVLSNRLEELAGFLNSLLKHKDVLGVLAADRRRAIRKAVDRSLDLSKSLNMTLSFSGLSMCEQSLVQLSNLSDILGEVEENRTFNSHEETEAELQAIENLKAENKALKRELDKRRQKERRSLPLAALITHQSESEAWSEPDRMVSLARIGLAENEHSSSVVKDTDSDSDDVRQKNRSDASKVHTNAYELRISYLEQLLSERDERILEIQSELVHVDSLLKRETLRVLELEKKLSESDVKDLQQQIENKNLVLNKLQEERDRIKVEADSAQLQLDVLKGEVAEVHSQYEQSLLQAEQQKEQKFQQLKHEFEDRLKEQQLQYANNLQADWVARQDHESLQKQLVQLQVELREHEYNLENLQEQEEDYKESLLNSELNERALKKQLEESTLQASKAVVERTKAVKEKLQLEQRVQELQTILQAHDNERTLLEQQIQRLENAQHKRQAVKEEPQAQSGYTSEELAQVASSLPIPPISKNISNRGNNTSSPDLGIESDAGRVSGVDTKANSSCTNLNKHQHTLKEDLSDGPEENMIPLNLNKKPLLFGSTETGMALPTAATSTTSTTSVHDCAKVDQENAELRRKLVRTKRAFEDTYEKLRIANQKKAQIEKDIKNQILKTNNVLKNVRSNMEN